MTESITQSEIDNIEKEVNAKLANETKKSNEELARRIREDVEKEMKAKQELEDLKAKQVKMEEEIAKAKAEATKAKEDAERQGKELQEAIKKQLEEAFAVKKGIALGNQNPFEARAVQDGPSVRTFPDGTKRDVNQLTPSELAAIEEESRQKFMDFLGIRDTQARAEWGIDPRKK